MNSKNDITVLFDPNWRALWEKRFVDPRDDAESFIISETGQILDIGRKGAAFDEIQGQFMGLLGLHAKVGKKLKRCAFKTALNTTRSKI